MRLTEKDEQYIGGYCCPGNPDIEWKEKAYSKLGQLEDIEEELGIDLITLFKALKSGVYYYSNQQLTKDNVFMIDKYINVCNDKLGYDLMTMFEKKILSFKDYGKTWALTK